MGPADRHATIMGNKVCGPPAHRAEGRGWLIGWRWAGVKVGEGRRWKNGLRIPMYDYKT